MEGSTFQLLKWYFGTEQSRGVKKSKLMDELVRRGVSPYGMMITIEEMFLQVGNAADNRIEEIDAQLDEEENHGQESGVDRADEEEAPGHQGGHPDTAERGD